MRLFFTYLRYRLKVILLFAVFCVIITVVYIMFALPVVPIVYSLMLCLVAGAVFAAFDFLSFCAKHKLLTDITDNLCDELPKLPVSDNTIEEDYRRIVERINEEKRRMATDTNEKLLDMNEYYSTWVHQIKTPIAAMQLVLRQRQDEVSLELLGQLSRIEQYVEMVLTYIRLDSDSSDLVIREYDLEAIVKPCVKKYSAQFITKKLSLDLQPLSFTVLTDEKWLSFVIEQVLSNSLKYTRKGTISVYAEPDGVLCIADTGIGIAPEDLPRIFEKGYTGYNGRKDKKASGIGLYLCRRICTKLGHTITAQSELGKGTIVRIDLRRDKLSFE